MKLIAHRGYQKLYPENTLLAFEQAIAAGARYLECDVQLTRDGVPVLYHDRDMKRISKRFGSIQQVLSQDLANIRAWEPERFGDTFQHNPVARLDDLKKLLLQHPQVHAFVEIKRAAIKTHGMAKVVNTVANMLSELNDRVTLISYSVEAVHFARSSGWPRVGVVLETWEQRHDFILNELAPDVIFCDVNFLPDSGMLEIGNAEIAVYEVDDIQVARKLVGRGVTYIETFAIGDMVSECGPEQTKLL